ncbi:MAG: DUF4975 domain-containing protein [Lachnospiraceae bacterium]|nr:DUF4975 domain-containing protein [Lachnospiraceae bacterium]
MEIIKRSIFPLLLVSGLVTVTACAGETPSPETEGNQTEQAESVQMPEQQAQAENENAYQSVPYRLYPVSENAWVGDVMPMVDGDRLQLYYLYDTDQNGAGYHPIYKFSTTDFCEYQDDGLVIPYGDSADDPDLAVGTGCVLKAQDGRYHCFYTGHNDSFPEKGLDRECVMHAVSDDNINWTKIPEDTFYAAENYSGDDFRDPFVFWNEDEQCYWLLIAAREESLGGVVARYTSTNLSEWTLCEPLYAPEKQYMLECPDLFLLGDKYYLFYSWDCVTYYAMSDSIYGPFTEPENNVLDGTGFSFYAAKTAEFNGVRYLCGWVGRKASMTDAGTYDWAGNLLIHELVQKEDGRLGVKEPSNLQDYFGLAESPAAVATVGDVQEGDNSYTLSADGENFAFVDFGMRKPEILLECTVLLEKDGCAGFAFGKGDEYNRYIGLTLDAKNNHVRFDGTALERTGNTASANTTDFTFEPGEEYHVKLIMENEIAILYIDDTKALSNRIYKSLNGAHWGLFTKNSKADFGDVKIRLPESLSD